MKSRERSVERGERERERLRECVSAGVHCGVLISCEGRCTESQHTGLSQRAFPEGETPATARPHTTDSPPPRHLCASSQDLEPLALFQLDQSSTETKRPGVFVPVSRAQRFSLCQPITSDQMSTHGSRDTALLRRKSAGSAPNILYHRALTLILRAATILQGSACGTLARASAVKRGKREERRGERDKGERDRQTESSIESG